MKKFMFTVLCLFVALLPLTLVGCGGGGSGTDATTTTLKTINVTKLLAVDDPISGASIKYGTSLDAVTGRITGTAVQSPTNASGEVALPNLQVAPGTKNLYFEVTGGTSGSTSMGNAFFTGVIELNTDETASQTITRVNVSPFTTLVANVKAKNPDLGLTKIAQEAVLPFFATTNIGNIDINSADYTGKTTAQGVETTGDAPLFQIMNEMIRVAAQNESGSSVPEKISNFVKNSLAEITTDSQKPLFSSTSGVFSSALSNISAQLSTNAAAVHGGFFSNALTVLTTSSTASFKPTTFETGTPRDTHFKIEAQFKVDNTIAKVNSVELTTSTSRAIITSSNGNALVLTSVPSMIVLTRSGNTYRPVLDTDFYMKWAKTNDDYIELTIRNARINIGTDSIFKMVFTTNSKLDAKNVKPGDTFTVTNKSVSTEKTFSSVDANHISLDIDELLSWIETISQQTGLKTKTEARFGTEPCNITISFGENVFFAADGVNGKFNEILMQNVTITQ